MKTRTKKKPFRSLASRGRYRKGRLNIASRWARALIGKEEGDSVEVRTPGGDRGYEVWL